MKSMNGDLCNAQMEVMQMQGEVKMMKRERDERERKASQEIRA